MATISNTPRPGYAWDSTDNVWYPIGTGPHTHADYITSGSAINPTIVDAKGDIIAATAADTVARLAVGANDTILTADSSTSTGLKWAAPAGGGKVLQVVQTTYSTATTNSTLTYADTGLTLSITPALSTSKVMVIVHQPLFASSSAAGVGGTFKIVRGATNIIVDVPNGSYQAPSGGSSELQAIFSYSYLDSPATTSSTTYKTQFKKGQGDSVQANNPVSTIILMEIGA